MLLRDGNHFNRGEFIFVQPGLNPRLSAQFLIQLAHGGFVIAGVAEENAERTIGHKDERFA